MPRSLDQDLQGILRAALEFDWRRVSFILEARICARAMTFKFGIYNPVP